MPSIKTIIKGVGKKIISVFKPKRKKAAARSKGKAGYGKQKPKYKKSVKRIGKAKKAAKPLKPKTRIGRKERAATRTYKPTASKEKADALPFTGRISTDVDNLVDIVNENGKIRTGALAKSMKVDEKQIEKWARILEENKLIKIHYLAMGKPELRSINYEVGRQRKKGPAGGK